MARVYSVQFNAVAVTAQQDLFEVLAPDKSVVVIHAIELEQTTEVGDAQEEGLSILLKRGDAATVSGTGGTTGFATPMQPSSSAFAGVVELNNTTRISGGSPGSIDTMAAWAWNVRMPFNKVFTPEMRPMVGAGGRITVELATTPTDSITMNGTLWFEVVGG